jgi:hypothetical protein
LSRCENDRANCLDSLVPDITTPDIASALTRQNENLVDRSRVAEARDS